jgi:serine/threonine-protein kinase
MYTEGFEGLEDTEKERRSYSTNPEMDRLLRENDRLKKSLEKEKFFNKLLDQEIQELKSTIPNGGNSAHPSEYWSGNRRVSKGAFYTLLFVTLLMAAYIGYGIYYDKRFSYLNPAQMAGATRVEPLSKVEPENTTNVAEQPKTTSAATQTEASAAPPVATTKDSVPNIIGDKKPAVQKQKQKASVALTPDDEYNEDEVNAAIAEKNKVSKPAPVAPAPRHPIAEYKVTSKANFYNSPDENTMRGTFISGSADKTVEALEDKNGFIYVEYTNDLGFTSKGWLSKKDLTKQ